MSVSMLAAYILRSEEMQNTTNDQIRNENTKFIIKHQFIVRTF